MPNFSTVFTARSTATHAITFECTKCRRLPRTSQMPSSGRARGAFRSAPSTPGGTLEPGSGPTPQ